MMLNPTLNRSLMVSSNSGIMMSEEDRMKISTMFYQYEIENNNAIIPNTEKILRRLFYFFIGADLKKLVELELIVWITHIILFSMIRAPPGHFDNKMIWVTSEHKFYFSPPPPTNNRILNSVNVNTNTELSDKRCGFMTLILKSFLVMRAV